VIKRILVLLGETPSSTSPRSYGYSLAQRTKASLTGLAGIDLAYIEAPSPGGIGAIAYKTRLEEQLKQQAEESRQRVREVFEWECSEQALDFDFLSFDGDPLEAVCSALETRDIAITGHDTAFRGNLRGDLSEILGRLLSQSPRPVIICANEASRSENILVAYDGSVPAMRAIQMFALLGIGRGQDVCVTSVDSNQELAKRRTASAADYLRSHGYEPEENPIVSRVNPAEALRIEAADRKIGTLVMGVYGHRGFRETLFGSTTTNLVEAPPCKLFVYH